MCRWLNNLSAGRFAAATTSFVDILHALALVEHSFAFFLPLVRSFEFLLLFCVVESSCVDCTHIHKRYPKHVWPGLSKVHFFFLSRLSLFTLPTTTTTTASYDSWHSWTRLQFVTICTGDDKSFAKAIYFLFGSVRSVVPFHSGFFDCFLQFFSAFVFRQYTLVVSLINAREWMNKY